MTDFLPLAKESDPPVLAIQHADEVHVAVVLDRVNVFFLKPGSDSEATAILAMDLPTLKALQKDINLNLPDEWERPEPPPHAPFRIVDSALVTIKPGENFEATLEFAQAAQAQMDLTTIRFKKPIGMEPEEFMALLQAAGFDVESIRVSTLPSGGEQ